MNREKLIDELPSFNKKQAADIALRLYEIEGEIRSLNSFEDQNFLVKTASDKFVLKIANKRWTEDELKVQTLLFNHLQITAPGATWPQVIRSKEGDAMTKVDGFNVRLLTFIEGNILADSERNSDLDFSIGKVLGLFSKAVQSFEGLVPVRPNDLWNLDNVMDCKAFLEDVIDEATRKRIEKLYLHYEEHVHPKIKDLRKATIHGDANEQNILVDQDDPNKIVGLIDFGDLQKATHINDLAITLAYSLLDVEDIDNTANQIIDGYQSQFKIEKEEFEVLFDLVAMRLISSIILSSKRAKQFPDNLYILASQKPAKVLLKRMETWEYKYDLKTIDNLI
jgi:Ser/Thr protein kinase RdoA (MazF antagonist)